MRRIELLVLVTLISFVAPPLRADRVIVMLRAPVLKVMTLEDRRDVIARMQSRVLSKIVAESVVRWKNVPGFAADVTRAGMATLAADPEVARVDLDVSGSGADKKSLALIGGDRVHALGFFGEGVTVAILDSGIDESHPDFSGRLIDEQCFCTNSDGSGCCPHGRTHESGAGSAADDEGHGTNVAGILASGGAVSYPGVAPHANIVAVKVLDSNNVFDSTAQVVSGLDWLISNHPEVRVINMSLLTSTLYSGHCDDTDAFTMAFASAIDTLRENGTATFAAAGNNEDSSEIGAPACVSSAISVGAVFDSNIGSFSLEGCTEAKTAADEVACFSDSDSTLDLLAPGVFIVSSGMGGGLSTFTGTSQATPHAAGSAAILFSIDPDLTVDDVETLLKETGKPILDKRNGVTTPRVNILAAVEQLLQQIQRRHAIER